MQIALENPDYRYICRGVSAGGVLVNERELRASFLLGPNFLLENWSLKLNASPSEADWQPVLAEKPSLFILGTGETQVFTEAKHIAFFLQRGIGFEVMNNAAAARTFNILANEGRNVLVGFVV
jgi:uncharacterized protein